MKVAGKTRWPERWIYELPRKVSFGVQGDGVEAQNSIDKALGSKEISTWHFAISDTEIDIFALVYELASKFQGVTPTRPRQSLEKLIEVLWPEGWFGWARQDSELLLDQEARTRGLQDRAAISTESFRIADRTVVDNARFCGKAWRPGTDEIQS